MTSSTTSMTAMPITPRLMRTRRPSDSDFSPPTRRASSPARPPGSKSHLHIAVSLKPMIFTCWLNSNWNKDIFSAFVFSVFCMQFPDFRSKSDILKHRLSVLLRVKTHFGLHFYLKFNFNPAHWVVCGVRGVRGARSPSRWPLGAWLDFWEKNET